MSLARIVASSPSAARHTARTLREAGYEVEIVPPGTPSNPEVDLEFDADADTLISQSTENHVPGEREFVLKPLWRKLTAKRLADRDVARARQQHSFGRADMHAAKSMTESSARTAAPAAPERHEEQAEREAALAAAEQQRLARQEARRAEEARIAREREMQQAARQRELEIERAEELRLQRVRQEQEAARQAELEAHRAAQLRQEQLRQQQELARQREYEQQQLVLRQQEEERQRELERKRQAEQQATYQKRLSEEREQLRLDQEKRQQAEEAHRQEVLRARQEEEYERRAEAQRLLLAANKQREESLRNRPEESALTLGEGVAETAAVPTIREYLNLRVQDWKRSRAKRSQVTRIDRSSAFASRQALPITAGVAAAFLLGWGIAAYRDTPPKASVQSAPPVLTQGQYAPYPTAKAPQHAASKPAHPKRRAVRDTSIAEDEVVTRHYYPSKTATAQNRTTQRKKITDLQ